MTTRTRQFIVLAIAFAAGAAASACKDKGILGDGGKQTTGAYAAGYNEAINRIPGFLKSYAQSVGDAEPGEDNLVRNKTSMCIGIWLDLAKVENAFSTAKSGAGEELSHLGPLADDMLAAVKDIDAQRTELCKYLDAEDYKDDKFARAKQLDKSIRASAEAYGKSVSAMGAALDEVEDKQVVAEIKKHESAKSASYWYRQFSHQSKKLLQAAQREPATFPAAYDSWLAHYQGLETFTKTKGDTVNASFKAYQGQADRFAAEAKKLRRAVEAAEAADKKAAAVAGGFDMLVSSYNGLIAFHEGFASLEEYNKLEN